MTDVIHNLQIYGWLLVVLLSTPAGWRKYGRPFARFVASWLFREAMLPTVDQRIETHVKKLHEKSETEQSDG